MKWFAIISCVCWAFACNDAPTQSTPHVPESPVTHDSDSAGAHDTDSIHDSTTIHDTTTYLENKLLVGPIWVMNSVLRQGLQQYPERTDYYLQFSDTVIYGRDVCNDNWISYSASDSVIQTHGPFASSAVECAEPYNLDVFGITSPTPRFADPGPANYKIHGDTLCLSNDSLKTCFVAQDSVPSAYFANFRDYVQVESGLFLHTQDSRTLLAASTRNDSLFITVQYNDCEQCRSFILYAMRSNERPNAAILFLRKSGNPSGAVPGAPVIQTFGYRINHLKLDLGLTGPIALELYQDNFPGKDTATVPFSLFY